MGLYLVYRAKPHSMHQWTIIPAPNSNRVCRTDKVRPLKVCPLIQHGVMVVFRPMHHKTLHQDLIHSGPCIQANILLSTDNLGSTGLSTYLKTVSNSTNQLRTLKGPVQTVRPPHRSSQASIVTLLDSLSARIKGPATEAPVRLCSVQVRSSHTAAQQWARR